MPAKVTSSFEMGTLPTLQTLNGEEYWIKSQKSMWLGGKR